MKRKILKILLILLLIFIGFSFYMSPSLVGLISGGKEERDKVVEKLEFTDNRNSNYQIKYKKHSNEPNLIKLRTDFKLDTIVKNAHQILIKFY